VTPHNAMPDHTPDTQHSRFEPIPDSVDRPDPVHRPDPAIPGSVPDPDAPDAQESPSPDIIAEPEPLQSAAPSPQPTQPTNVIVQESAALTPVLWHQTGVHSGILMIDGQDVSDKVRGVEFTASVDDIPRARVDLVLHRGVQVEMSATVTVVIQALPGLSILVTPGPEGRILYSCFEDPSE
jgi:hypothetical protein